MAMPWGQILEIVIGRRAVAYRCELDEVERVRDDSLRLVQVRAESFPQHRHDLVRVLPVKAVVAAPMAGDLNHGDEGVGLSLQGQEAAAEQGHKLGKTAATQGRPSLLMQHINTGFCHGVSTMCPSVT